MVTSLKPTKKSILKGLVLVMMAFFIVFSVPTTIYATDATSTPTATETPKDDDKSKSEDSAADQEKVREGINSIEITPNVAEANRLMSGFQDIIGIAVGLLAYVIVIGLPLFSAVDIAYITIPVLRNFADEAKAQGNGAIAKSDGKGGTKFRWISDEAVYAVKQGSMNEGKSALSIYFGKRVVTYIVCAVVLYLLISGNINTVTEIAVNVVSGIIGVLENLAVQK